MKYVEKEEAEAVPSVDIDEVIDKLKQSIKNKETSAIFIRGNMPFKEEFLTPEEIEQMFIEERLDQLRQKLIEEAKFRREHPCYPCNTAVLGIITHSQSAIEELEAIREMDKSGAKEKIMQGKFTFTKSELESRVKSHKCWIQKNWDRYTKCCETDYLEDVGPFEC